jgi:hypothetical protein
MVLLEMERKTGSQGVLVFWRSVEDDTDPLAG